MSEDRVVKRTPSYEISVHHKEGIPVINVSGRFTSDLLNPLRDLIDEQPGNVAVRTKDLSSVGSSLARELIRIAKAVKNKGGNLFLVSPDPNLRNYIQIIYEDRNIQIVHSVEDLGEDTETGPQIPPIELSTIRKELNGQAAWQYRDSRENWICPFCLSNETGVRFPEAGLVTSELVETVYRHLKESCSTWRSGHTIPNAADVVAERRRRIDGDTESVVQSRLQELQSQVENTLKTSASVLKGVRAAQERRKKLLPTEVPHFAHGEISVVFHIGERMAGDFFDFITMPDGRFIFFIGDATGEGAEGSLLMAVSKKVLQIRMKETFSPAAALKKANQDLEEDLTGKAFVTAFAAVYDPVDRTLCMARAGHLPPLLYSPNGDGKDIAELAPRGMTIGIGGSRSAFNKALEEKTIDIREGDLVLLISDGARDAQNRRGSRFGNGRIKKLVKAFGDRSVDHLTGTIEQRLEAFLETDCYLDDVTIIGIRFDKEAARRRAAQQKPAAPARPKKPGPLPPQPKSSFPGPIESPKSTADAPLADSVDAVQSRRSSADAPLVSTRDETPTGMDFEAGGLLDFMEEGEEEQSSPNPKKIPEPAPVPRPITEPDSVPDTQPVPGPVPEPRPVPDTEPVPRPPAPDPGPEPSPAPVPRPEPGSSDDDQEVSYGIWRIRKQSGEIRCFKRGTPRCRWSWSPPDGGSDLLIEGVDILGVRASYETGETRKVITLELDSGEEI